MTKKTQKQNFLIVPVYNNPELTEKFLYSLKKNNLKKIIIVDDNPLGLHNFLSDKEDILVLKGNGLQYWGGSINLAIDFIQKNYIVEDKDFFVLANNDIIVEFDLNSFFNEIKDDSNSTFHVKVIDKKGNPVKSCAIIKSWFPFIQKYPQEFHEKRVKVDTLTARFLAIPSSIISEIGGIDPGLPQYGGDSDFGLRVKRAGYNNFLLRDFHCTVDLEQTGLLRAATIKNLWTILTDIKSSFNLQYRWYFVRNHNSLLFAPLVFFSMYFKLMALLIMKSIFREKRLYML